jgi:hypothetical protein
VRVTTAFNKMLDLPGGSVATVAFTADGLVLGLRRSPARPVCPCGKRGAGVYDRSVRRWRHLDWGVSKVWLEGRADAECSGTGALTRGRAPRRDSTFAGIPAGQVTVTWSRRVRQL